MSKNLFLISAICLIWASCGSNKETEPAETTSDAPKSLVADVVEIPTDLKPVLRSNTCLTCHRADEKLVGPSYKDIAQKVSSEEEIIELIRHPKPDRWAGYPPMAGINVSDEEGKQIAAWILSLKD